MATRWRPNLDEIPLDGALTLVVAWRVGDDLEAAMVPVSTDVADGIREGCARFVERLRENEAIGYDPDGHIDRGTWMAVPMRVVEEEASAVLSVLGRAAALERLSARDIPARLLFYASVLGDDPESRIALLKKSDPHRVAKPGRVIGSYGETLGRIEDPVFLLEDAYGLAVVRDGLAVVNENSFEMLFREAPELTARLPRYVESVAAALPFAEGAGEALADACARNSRFARRLRAIYERGHLQGVTL